MIFLNFLGNFYIYGLSNASWARKVNTSLYRKRFWKEGIFVKKKTPKNRFHEKTSGTFLPGRCLSDFVFSGNHRKIDFFIDISSQRFTGYWGACGNVQSAVIDLHIHWCYATWLRIPLLGAGLLRSKFRGEQDAARSTLRVECILSDAPRPIRRRAATCGHSTRSVERELNSPALLGGEFAISRPNLLRTSM